MYRYIILQLYKIRELIVSCIIIFYTSIIIIILVHA